MPVLLRALEQLMFAFMGVARACLLLLGLAPGCAALIALALSPLSQESPWIRHGAQAALIVSIVLMATSVLMGLVSRRHAQPPDAGGDEVPGPGPIGAVPLVLTVVAALAASTLPSLWGIIASRLAAIGFWDAARAGADPFAGIVLIPVAGALFVPVLVTATSLASIMLPLALVPLGLARRPLFPMLLTMGTICQGGLAIGGFVAQWTVGRVARPALASMAASGDLELGIATDLTNATEILARTTSALLAPLLGMLVWIIVVHLTTRPTARRAPQVSGA